MAQTLTTLFLTAWLLLLGATPAFAAEGPPWSGTNVLDDPEWRARFLGSYGFLSGVEPDIRASELELLREVIDLMKANPRAAATVLREQVGEDSSAAVDFILANLDFQNGDQESAIRYYQSALAKFPDFRRAHKNLGLLLVQRSDFAGALEHLSQAVALGDRDGRTSGLIGYCYLNLENYLAAEIAYQGAVVAQPQVRDWQLGLARALLAMKKYEDAVALFGALIESTPDDANIWLLQANAFVGLEQPMAAAVNLEAVRMMGKPQSSSLVLLGDIYMNAGMPDLARSAYMEVIQRDEAGTQVGTAMRAVDLLTRTRAYEEAAELIASTRSRYTDLSTDDELQLLTLEAKVARAKGRDSEAARILESIVERDGTRGEALLELASYHRSQGNREKALLLIERAQRLEAFEYRALLEHAQLRVAAKDYPRAAELLREALAIKYEARVEGFLARVEQAIR